MLKLNGSDLTISEVVAVARNGEGVSLTAQAIENIRRARRWVEEIVAAGKPVYGINTLWQLDTLECGWSLSRPC